MSLVCITGFGYAYPGASDWILKNVDLVVERGECHCLVGGTGTGKSTLVKAIKGLLPQGRQTGRIDIGDDGSAGQIGLVLQNPEPQMLMGTVAEEVAFGLENQGVDPAMMPEMVAEVLDAVGLDKSFDCPTSHLSMGQKYRLLIAAVLVLDPVMVILDEPIGQLDPAGIASLVDLIGSLKKCGISFLLCEHQCGPLAEIIDYRWQLKEGGLAPAPEQKVAEKKLLSCPPLQTAEPLVHVRNMTPELALQLKWQDISLKICRGERIGLSGPNGSGKTSFLRTLAGFLIPCRGSVMIYGQAPKPAFLRGRMGFLLQNPQRQLFESSVFDEVAFGLRRSGFKKSALSRRVHETLGCCGIEDLAARSPHKLSFGQRHLVALAAVLAMNPELLLLDDPFAGLDHDYVTRIEQLLVRISDQEKMAVLCTSHNTTLSPAWVHRNVRIEGGSFVEN